MVHRGAYSGAPVYINVFGTVGHHRHRDRGVLDAILVALAVTPVRYKGEVNLFSLAASFLYARCCCRGDSCLLEVLAPRSIRAWVTQDLTLSVAQVDAR